VNAGRALRAAIHGFVGLESRDALGDGETDESFRHLVSMLSRGLQSAAAST
jgi:hypothetical protein